MNHSAQAHRHTRCTQAQSSARLRVGSRDASRGSHVAALLRALFCERNKCQIGNRKNAHLNIYLMLICRTHTTLRDSANAPTRN